MAKNIDNSYTIGGKRVPKEEFLRVDQACLLITFGIASVMLGMYIGPFFSAGTGFLVSWILGTIVSLPISFPLAMLLKPLVMANYGLNLVQDKYLNPPPRGPAPIEPSPESATPVSDEELKRKGISSER